MRRDRRPGVDTSSEQAFGRTGVGVSNIFGSYYYTYLMTSLALQLSFCFEVRTLSDRLVSSAP
jgi:cytochrome c biogenesis protein ResB